MKELRKPCRHYQFFQAVRLLERMHGGDKGIGDALSPREEKIRFSSRKGFSFPTSDISKVEEVDDGLVRVEVAFMGLIGPSGVLPNWYHELLLERLEAKDHAMGEFYDLFHHRLISLFYRAWKRNNLLAQKRPDNIDSFSHYLLSLIGLGTGGIREALGQSEQTLLSYSGQASRHVPSACTLEKVIGQRFGTAAEVEQFVPCMVELEQSDRTMLGQANSSLGLDTVCGTTICDCQSTFRLHLGPMSYSDFSEFVTRPKLTSLVSLIKFLVGLEYGIEVRLILKREDAPPLRLGEVTAKSPRLGCSTWLTAPGSILGADPFVTIREAEVDGLPTEPTDLEQTCLQTR